MALQGQPDRAARLEVETGHGAGRETGPERCSAWEDFNNFKKIKYIQFYRISTLVYKACYCKCNYFNSVCVYMTMYDVFFVKQNK